MGIAHYLCCRAPIPCVSPSHRRLGTAHHLCHWYLHISVSRQESPSVGHSPHHLRVVSLGSWQKGLKLVDGQLVQPDHADGPDSPQQHGPKEGDIGPEQGGLFFADSGGP